MRKNGESPKGSKDYKLICALLVSALFVILNDDFGLRLWHAYQSSEWQSTEGYMQESRMPERCSQRYCNPIIRYSYNVDGRPYTGINITPVAQERYSSGKGERKSEEYRAGTNVKVYFDPADPRSSCLEPGFDTVVTGTYLIVLFGIAVGGIGVALLIKDSIRFVFSDGSMQTTNGRPTSARGNRSINRKRREKWKETRRAVLGHHLLNGELIRAATVRLTPRESGWRTVFEWHPPNPTFLQVDEKGITFARGEDPQDDSVLQGKQTLRFPWADIESVKFSKWYRSAVKISLKSGHYGFDSIFVRWLADSSIRPYDIYKTEAVYHLLEQYHAKSFNNRNIA